MNDANKSQPIHATLFGVAIGDALGVPAEFMSREKLALEPITDYEGYRSHDQPAGTFSDDSSLTFCLAESLVNGYDPQDIGKKFIAWYREAYWTAHNELFDIGMTTKRAIERLERNIRPDLAGDYEEENNGNGSLMRIMPLLFYIKDMDINQRFAITKAISSITHAHIRSVIACFYYLEFANRLLQGMDKKTAYEQTAAEVLPFITKQDIVLREIALFDPLLKHDITQYDIATIPSFGYVMNTLKASMWCFMSTDNYAAAVLAAVNLGNDADTTGAVTGGLAGLYYGYDQIPEKWKTGLHRHQDVDDLCNRLAKQYL
ncbi:ADP-ribosylglycohydrolase family protein [Chitinophaga agrisoli]|uniref:ADP-ribosylglycohydrolase family protein n=1 Tax=Chitinophaga agrisoli TaxID=2607653 RepID=A0A5B2VRH5_9BACT|nr:ADP-ribosylglycohydrolase family protein [Chitinophaga agrisoli]KAA2240787.1 ADP-ribosylglycohydrolase family protein [Chitinophaga agrisoli]